MEEICRRIRRDIITLLYKAQTCHLGSDLSVVEILSTLYFKVLRDYDKFLSSEGHVAAAFYLVLAEKGYFKKEELFDTYAKEGTKFLNLIHNEVPGVLISSGALGHGLPVALGLAMAKKLNHEPGRIFCLISDGELDCGTTWESALLAAHHNLDNLVLIINNNQIQACGFKKDILNVDPIGKKFEAFDWEVREVDGHDVKELEWAFNRIDDERSYSDIDWIPKLKPLVIIANTIKCKGVSFAEDQVDWHYRNLSESEYLDAMKQLE